jgi:hypothetical protein
MASLAGFYRRRWTAHAQAYLRDHHDESVGATWRTLRLQGSIQTMVPKLKRKPVESFPFGRILFTGAYQDHKRETCHLPL